MGDFFRLRPVRILVASLDRRFEGVVSFLLRRYGFDVATARQPIPLDELATRHEATLAVIDEDTYPDHRAQLAMLDVGVVVVGEHAEMPKWGPFEHLLAELDRLLAARPLATARVVHSSRVEATGESAGAIARPSRPGV